MNFKIRKAGNTDYPHILDMIKELALFEKAPEKVTNSVEQMKNESEYFNCLIVEDENQDIIAMALYFFAYFTWVGKSLYLDDLYVREKYRGNKIGSALLSKLFQIAREENCKRVRWQVLDWNTDAIEFYEKVGATLESEWINCDFDAEAIKNFPQNEPNT